MYIEKNEIADTPEQLMRSRYSAYSLARTDYIKKTMHGKALLGFNEVAVEKQAQVISWIGLKIITSYLEHEDQGFVEFAATYLQNNHLNTMHERSEFHKINNHWFYVDGQHLINTNNKRLIGRNSPCPCGSGKKFKNCHQNP